MTNNKPQPITIPDAYDEDNYIKMRVGYYGNAILNAATKTDSVGVNLPPRNARALRDWLNDYLGDSATTADDGWEEVTDWKKNPPRPGDEVERIDNVNGVTHFSRGIFDHLSEGLKVRTRKGGGLGYVDPDCGIWRVRRAPEPDPADVLTPGTILRDVTTLDGDDADVAQVESDSECAIGVWRDGYYGHDTCDLSAFTVESTGDRWEKKDGRWTVTKKEGQE